MPDRRTFIALGAAAIALPGLALPSFARNNPMPETLRRDLERAPAAPTLGNPQGDITLVEFFDYNCQFCRKMVPRVQALIGADPGLRVVFREWPVFGEGSQFAARASLASLPQGKYWSFHAALMAMRGRAEEASVMRVAREVGLDIERLRTDMEAETVWAQIEQTAELADHMQLIGTPTFIAGDEAVFGENTLEELRALVARGRTALQG